MRPVRRNLRTVSGLQRSRSIDDRIWLTTWRWWMRLKLVGRRGKAPPAPLDAGRQVGRQTLIISILPRHVDGAMS